MTGRVRNKIALVTAAGDGIGEAIGRRLAGEGATVVLTDLDGSAVEAIAADLGGAAMGLAHDAGDPEDWHKVIDAVKERHGKLDVMVNNAGVSRAGSIEDQSLEDLQFVIRVNLEGTFLGCKHAIGLMKGGGSIVNISSIHGIQAAPHEAAYSATKGAVTLLTKSVAMHCAEKDYKIRCNSVHPGYIMTTMMNKWLDESDDRAALEDGLIAKHPIGYLGSPDDVAHGVVYLASEESRFVTGSEMVIDGGYLM